MSEEEDERDQLASSSGGGGGSGEREEEEEEEEDLGEQRKGLTHLTWNYVLDTLEKCKQEREKHQDQRASSSQAFNVLAKRKRRTEAKRVRIGIVIEVKEGAEVVTTKRLPLHNVTPKGNDSQNGSRKRNRSASTTKKKIWDVTLGSFTSCCINSVLVEEQNKEDFIAPGAVVRYATTKASTSAASSPPTKVEGCDFRLLDVLHCQSKCQQENGSTLPSRSHLLRVWSQRHFQSTMSYIRSIENMSRFELALLKARIVSVVRVEIGAGSEFGDGKGKGERSFGSRREFIEQSLRRRRREEEDDYASSSRDFDLSLVLEIDDCTGIAKCRVAGTAALDVLRLVDQEILSAMIRFCRDISKFYRRECVILFQQEGKMKGCYDLKTPDFVNLAYPLYKKLFKCILSLCSRSMQTDALNFLCQRNSSPATSTQNEEMLLDVLHCEKKSSLHEILKHMM